MEVKNKERFSVSSFSLHILAMALRHKRAEPGTVLKCPLFAVTASKSLARRQHCFVFFLVPTKI